MGPGAPGSLVGSLFIDPREQYMRYLLVALGGAVAATVRYSATLATGVRRFPYATLGVNLTGAFLFGLVITLTVAGRIPRDIGTGATVGFLGAYTTFATFAWESYALFRANRITLAVTYVTASVLLGVLAAACGHFLARAVPS
jgi:fluoride exporter